MRATKKLTVLSIVAVLLAALTFFATPASAAPGATIDSIERAGCVLTITVTVEDSVEYALEIWDDGTQLDSQTFTPAAGATAVLTYTIVSDVSAGAPGLGIFVTHEGANMDFVDPYDFPGSGDIGQACRDSGGEDSGESTTTVTEPVESTTTTSVPAPPASNAPPPAAAPAAAVAADPAYTG